MHFRMYIPLFVAGVVRVFYGSDFVTVTKSDDVNWSTLKPDIFAAIMDFFASGEPLFTDKSGLAADTAIHEVRTTDRWLTCIAMYVGLLLVGRLGKAGLFISNFVLKPRGSVDMPTV